MKKTVLAALMLVSGIVGSNSARATIDRVGVVIGGAVASFGAFCVWQGEPQKYTLDAQNTSVGYNRYLFLAQKYLLLGVGSFATTLGLAEIKDSLCS